MLRPFQYALQLLTRRERLQIWLLLALSGVAAVVQMLVILLAMPFIMLLAEGSMIDANPLLQRLQTILRADSYQEFLVLLGTLSIVALAVGNTFLAFEQWFSHRCINLFEHRMGRSVLWSMLHRPYDYLLKHNTAGLGNVIHVQIQRVVEGVIGSFLSIFSNLALVMVVVAMLLVISLQTTLVTLIGLVILYLAVFMIFRRRIARHGAELTSLSQRFFAQVTETLDGAREIKTRRIENVFVERFALTSLKWARLSIRFGLLSFLPFLVLETLVFAGLVGVALYFIFSTQDVGSSLSLIALYGFAAYRLVPSLKGIFEGFSTMNHDADAVRVVLEHCDDEPVPPSPREVAAPSNSIGFEKVSHCYDGSGELRVNDVSLKIPAGSSVCFFGPSGSGKSTLLHVLIGLIHPSDGRVLCDGMPIDETTVDAWRDRIGYCPQRLFLFEDSVASNIAFGVPAERIDKRRMEEVARLALAHDFIVRDLERGYDTILGQDGKTLSGGQRQRLGIARALYHDPDVIVLDESLSGLDAANRAAVMTNLLGLRGKTIVMSSHEDEVASRCDDVVLIDQGRLVAQGRFEDLAANNAQFARLRKMADLRSGD